MRTFIVRGFWASRISCMCDGSLYQNIKRIRNWPMFSFWLCKLKLSRFWPDALYKTIKWQFAVPPIPRDLLNTQGKTTSQITLLVTQCHAWKAIPPCPLLGLAFLSELLLLTVAFVALLSLKKHLSARASRSPEFQGLQWQCCLKQYFLFHVLHLPAVNFIKILYCESLKKGGSSVFSAAFVWRLPGQIRPWKSINSVGCHDTASRAEKNSGVILKKTAPSSGKFSVASGFLMSAFLINRQGRYYLLFSEIMIICFKYQQHWKSCIRRGCRGGCWPGFHCSPETMVDL